MIILTELENELKRVHNLIAVTEDPSRKEEIKRAVKSLSGELYRLVGKLEEIE